MGNKILVLRKENICLFLLKAKVESEMWMTERERESLSKKLEL